MLFGAVRVLEVRVVEGKKLDTDGNTCGAPCGGGTPTEYDD